MDIKKLTASELIEAVRLVPAVAVDLLISNGAGQVLLGLRANRPAAGTWFVPGGRILKGERISEALERIGREELGLDIDFDATLFHGVFEHFYDDNFAGSPGITTHYVTLAFTAQIDESVLVHLDNQHTGLRWFVKAELLASGDVHENTKKYFRGRSL